MRLHPRCLIAGLLACAGCFTPHGLPETTGDPVTTGPTSMTGGPSGSEGSTTRTSAPTSEPTSTSLPGETSVDPTSTGPGDTTDGTDGTDGTTTTTAVCGDRVVEGDEECDDGEFNGDELPCTSTCRLGYCGDGLVCPGCGKLEACDDGGRPNGGCDDDCQVPVCGDGEVGDGEECEPPGMVDECTDECLFPHHYIFVSSALLRGDQVLDGDQLCGTLAASQFSPKRQFIAWVSTPGDHVRDRMGPGYYEYVKPMTNEAIAYNRDDLLDGLLLTPIDRNELGVSVLTEDGCSGTSGVWTGTESNGYAATDTCGLWNDNVMMGRAGQTSQVDARWSSGCLLGCFNELPVYCIEKTS